VRRSSLTRYLFFSIFLHMGLLLGVDAVLRSPPKVIPVDLVPVEIVIFEEEPVPPQPKPTIPQQVLARKTYEAKSRTSTRTLVRPKADDMVRPAPKAGDFEPRLSIDQAALLDVPPVGREKKRAVLETKSRISAGTETRVDVRDLPGPIPKEGNFEPSLNVDSAPTLGVLPSGREGKEVVSKPVVSTFQLPPLRLSPVQPSRLDQPAPLEVEMARVLVDAETGGVETYSQTQKKIETPIGRNRLSADIVSELPPIPTVESPSIPEQREMILAPSDDLLKERLGRSETTRKPQFMTQSDLRLALKKEPVATPKLLVPKEEAAALDLKSGLSSPVPGSAKGAAFFFVVDTSGSVKGAPLEGIKRSALEFVRLMGENDRAGIMTFNDRTELVRPFTSEKSHLTKEINRLRTAGKWTVLFDALMGAITAIQKEDRESKVVILFSDGKDEGSRSTLQDVIQKIRRSGVSILSVGYSRVEKRYLEILEKIAGETGGVYADAPQFHEIVMLYRAARDTSAQEGQSVQTP